MNTLQIYNKIFYHASIKQKKNARILKKKRASNKKLICIKITNTNIHQKRMQYKPGQQYTKHYTNTTTPGAQKSIAVY